MSDPTIFECIRWYDPEIASKVEPGRLGEYAVQRPENFAAFLGLADERPIVFRCRTLTRSQRRTVQQQPSDEARYELAFRFGLVGMRNWPGPNGPQDWTPSRQKEDAALEDAAIDATKLADSDLWEIGSVVYSRSFLPLGTPLRCPQLDSSLRAWAAVRFQSAGQSPGSETPPAT